MHDINLIQIILVTLVAFVADMVSALDGRQLHCPLVAYTLTGIALGNPAVGIVVGGSLELLASGWMNVGTAMAPDSALTSTVSTTTAVASVDDASSTRSAIAAAISVAVLLAVASQALTILVRAVAIFFAHQADRFAEQASYRGIAIIHFAALSLQGLCVAIPTAMVTVLASGNTVKHTLDTVPKVITEGLSIAGGFIVVVGYTTVIDMMKARKLTPFFFLGFIFATFATAVGGSALVSGHSKDIDEWVIDLTPNGTTPVALGILGVCLAVIYIQLNPEFHDSARLPAAASSTANDGSSSDLDDDLDDKLD